MSIETMREFLGWCAVINLGVLLWWFLVFALARDWLHRLHGRWFRVPVEQFATLHYAGMGLLKMGVILFNLVPYAALHIVG